jgi:hypothetical protein
MKITPMNILIIGVLSYYLIKGLMALLMWQTLVVMEDKGKKRVAREKQERREKIKRSREIRDNANY